jgi:thioester reductase-like protein
MLHSVNTRLPRSTGGHLVTGSTGFIGGALVLELLARTEGRVVVVVRDGDRGASARFHDAIRHAATLYEDARVGPEAIAERCHVVSGDVLSPSCGVDAREVGSVDQVWHSAASLRYEDRYHDEIRATNVDGTRNALALAEQLGASTFNHVSTAYVSGRRTGMLLEEPAEEVETHNHYERSKIDGESLVRAASGLRTRIFRPSIVVGHSRTLGATTFSGFYGFVRQLVQYRGMLERTNKELLAKPVTVKLDPEATLDFVAVDQVVQDAVGIGLSERSEGFYHLTNRSPPKVGAMVSAVFATLGMCAPRFVSPTEELDWLDAKFDQRLEFYGAYLRGRKHFARTRADEALGGTNEQVVCDSARIDAMGRFYLKILERQRERLPPAR